MAQVIDGKALAKKIRENLKVECNELKEKGIVPKLAVIMVGDNPASKVYVRNKSKACEEVGIEYQEFLLKENTTQQELMDLINDLNRNKEIKKIERDIFELEERLSNLNNELLKEDVYMDINKANLIKLEIDIVSKDIEKKTLEWDEITMDM